MKYVKILGLLTAAAAALLAFAVSSSATMTSPPGTVYEGPIRGTATNVVAHPFPITCSHSEFEGTHAKGATSGSVDRLTYTGCNRSTTVTAKGTISIASDGTVRSTGARTTLQTTILGFPVHCIYATNNTKIGSLTEGVAPAQIHIGSAAIPQEATSGACGDDAVWTGTYTITFPTGPIVVH